MMLATSGRFGDARRCRELGIQVGRCAEDCAGNVFLTQTVLGDQLSIREQKLTVNQVIDAAAKAAGGPITVTRFARLKVGEAT